jgi:putative holliday junction resolvase
VSSRAIGVDLGSKRIGLAISDSDGRLAVPLETITRSGRWAADHAAIADAVLQAQADVVVVGMPLSMDGSVGPAARRTNKELGVLRRTLGVPVETYDERLSTVEAESSLRAAEVSASRRSRVIDSAAASVILQGWLDARRGGGAAGANRESGNRESGK